MYYSYDIVYGVANEEKVGQGIYSHEVSKKVLKKIYLSTSARNGNIIKLYKEKELIFEVPDTVVALDTDNPKTCFDIDVEIPVGQHIYPALSCGGSASTVTIVFAYEEIR